VSPGPALRSVESLELGGQRVFLRADLNVPLRAGRVADDTRIRAVLQTLSHVREQGGRAVLASHLGRPKGKASDELSLRPVAEALGIALAPDCIGPDAVEQVSRLRDGDTILLENLRFHAGEEANDPEFVAALAELADLYVNDAFGTAHRAHASTEGLARALGPDRSAAGFLLAAEVEALSRVRDTPERPYLCVLGGAKVSDKLAVLEALAARADTVAVGGAMAYTFLLARGEPVGNSLVEPDLVDTARRLLDGSTELILPCDHVVAPDPESADQAQIMDVIPDGCMALDIGPKSVEVIAQRVAQAATVFWNGPLGLFEREPFNRGSNAVAEALASCPGYTVVGGGDSLAAVHQSGCGDRISHLSTGGGAALQFLEGRSLPGLEPLWRPA
jgi:phosphoglycerate kinase